MYPVGIARGPPKEIFPYLGLRYEGHQISLKENLRYWITNVASFMKLEHPISGHRSALGAIVAQRELSNGFSRTFNFDFQDGSSNPTPRNLVEPRA
jgi:hypothetical protein